MAGHPRDLTKQENDFLERAKIVFYALDGQTPADRYGIQVEGGHKQLTIIQNASREKGKL